MIENLLNFDKTMKNKKYKTKSKYRVHFNNNYY